MPNKTTVEWGITNLVSKSLSSLTSASIIAICVFSEDHGVDPQASGPKIKVSGADQDEFNGTFDADVIDSTTIQYTMSGPTAGTATGTITVQVAEVPIEGFVSTVEPLTQADQDDISNRETAITASYNTEFPLWDYATTTLQIDKKTTPLGLNYKTEVNKKFSRKDIINDVGELTQRIYYADESNDGSFDIPLVKVDFTYVRDIYKKSTKQVATRSWYRRDETIGPDTKVSNKFYSTIEAIHESERRRHNIFHKMHDNLFDMVLISQDPADDNAKVVLWNNVMAAMAEMDGDINAYVKFQDMTVNTTIDGLNTTTYAWLTDSITQAMVDAGYALQYHFDQSYTMQGFMKDKLDKINA